MYPEHDDQFEDKTIEKVETDDKGRHVITCDGWSLYCGDDCPVVPEVGQVSRHYGRGIGSTVRGLFINGAKIWYRTEAEEKEHGEIQLYGADAAEWLKRWDGGGTVWSIEMGGLGPGYEQAIQVTVAEILRWFLEHKPDLSLWEDETVYRAQREEMDKWSFANPTIKALGLSGAQFGAAVSLASKLYRDGPRHVMQVKSIKDRHIQVSRNFPGMAA